MYLPFMIIMNVKEINLIFKLLHYEVNLELI